MPGYDTTGTGGGIVLPESLYRVPQNQRGPAGGRVSARNQFGRVHPNPNPKPQTQPGPLQTLPKQAHHIAKAPHPTCTRGGAHAGVATRDHGAGPQQGGRECRPDRLG
eukprot:1727816-Rhodomonas_salina.1